MKNRRLSFKTLKNAFRSLKNIAKEKDGYYKPVYRVASIEQDETGEYYIVIQMIGKSTTYKTKPEKLLGDDELVDLFSPRDIRNLTYLGYLGINGPKYKILAKRLLKDKDQTIFAVIKKGEKKYKTVTASEISTNEEILQGLTQKDAHMIGFTSATEHFTAEKQQKEKLLKQLKNDAEKHDFDEDQKS